MEKSCFLVVIVFIARKVKESILKMRCISPLALPKYRDAMYRPLRDSNARVWVPCGQCYACRVNLTSQWVFRMMLELTDWKTASFITLTYEDSKLPTGNSLYFDDLKDFWKRLRKRLGYKIKYYACGEYGDNDEQIWYGNYLYHTDGSKTFLGRPHFHAIVFGLPPNEETRRLLCDTWKFCDPLRFLYKSKGVAPVTVDDIAYVAGYCQKKLNGDLGKKSYLDQGIQPPQSRQSHYIGLNAFESNIENVLEYGCVYWNGSKMPIPRYFRKKFAIDVSYRPDDQILNDAKIVYGNDFTPLDLKFYRFMDNQGYLKELLQDRIISYNEQRKRDHLYAVRQRASLRASRQYTNRSFE